MGFCCPNDEKVIHYTGRPGSKANAEVRETSREEFASGADVKDIEVVRYGKCVSIDETLTLAREQVGERRYSLVFNNCEPGFPIWVEPN